MNREAWKAAYHAWRDGDYISPELRWHVGYARSSPQNRMSVPIAQRLAIYKQQKQLRERVNAR